ncbi:hypothetical protein QJQ45_007572 [Haematococcus lacustris]|nr:hypothetical protein QJQ45_007572 [Haematococcus lacustris]
MPCLVPPPPSYQAAQLPSLGAHELAVRVERLSTASCKVLWAFASHEHCQAALLRAAAPVLSARILQGQLSSRRVACVAWAYARLQQLASWSAESQLAARELMRDEFTLSPDTVLGTKSSGSRDGGGVRLGLRETQGCLRRCKHGDGIGIDHMAPHL